MAPSRASRWRGASVGAGNAEGKKDPEYGLEEGPGSSPGGHQALVDEAAARFGVGARLRLEGEFGSRRGFWDDASHSTGDTRYS